MELNNKISAVVVGGASGMGEATVRALQVMENSYLSAALLRLDGGSRI